MYRIQFPTFEDYQEFIASLPDGTEYDESPTAVKIGKFSYLTVLVPNANERFYIDRPPHVNLEAHKLLSTYTHINYQCVCGEEDGFMLRDGDNHASYSGCCKNTVYAYRMPNGEIELDTHER